MTETMKDMKTGEVRLFYKPEEVDDALEAAIDLLFKSYGYANTGIGTSTTGVRVMAYRLKE